MNVVYGDTKRQVELPLGKRILTSLVEAIPELKGKDITLSDEKTDFTGADLTRNISLIIVDIQRKIVINGK